MTLNAEFLAAPYLIIILFPLVTIDYYDRLQQLLLIAVLVD